MMQVDDLDFADDLTLLLHTQQQMQEKTTSVAAASATVCLNIHKGKSKIIRYNTTRTKQITLDEEYLENVNTFTYLGTIIREHDGSDVDMKARIDKCLSTNTNVRIFNTNVKTALLYGVGNCRTTKAIIKKKQMFINSCLCKILQIRLPRHYYQQPTIVKENKSDFSGGSNQEELLEVA
ncbi:unnamed protein product [Schistosoma margrebowiei]|uniref:Uncharacterized protein n=1 Tax=Schistosoma margrebowiei TaxID=48269 RepID=A0A183LNE1_9TREM|nr:unnamed protein product [Schistosoma margrebowiei]